MIPRGRPVRSPLQRTASRGPTRCFGFQLLGLTTIGFWLAGCAAPGPAGLDLAARRAQAEADFARAVLLKPATDSPLDEALTYAPILVEAVATPPVDAPVDSDLPQRAVYAGEMTAELRAAPYRQWVYWWWYPADAGSAAEARAWCWLRITLDSRDLPVIWETLSSRDRFISVYVAQSLEDAARRQFAAPEPGCRFVVERAGAAQTRIGLVRVLSEGPVPMGPMVYLDANHQVTSVICRCMPSQVRDVAATGWFTLEPAETAPGQRAAPDVETLFLPGKFFKTCPHARKLADPRFLDQALRLPDGF